MDKQTSRQGKVRLLRIPGTQWALVRVKDVHRLEVSNQVRAKIINRQIDEQRHPLQVCSADGKREWGIAEGTVAALTEQYQAGMKTDKAL